MAAGSAMPVWRRNIQSSFLLSFCMYGSRATLPSLLYLAAAEELGEGNTKERVANLNSSFFFGYIWLQVVPA